MLAMPDMIKNIRQIFTADQLFRIPDYQRGYAWEEKQCNDLFEDLDLLQKPRQTHFMGTLVLCLVDGELRLDIAKTPYQVMEVIDGQQRLTTIIILLKTILEEMRQLSGFEPTAKRLCETYLYAEDPNGQPLIKLTPNQDCEDFFRDVILGINPGIQGTSIRAQERMVQATMLFRQRLGERRVTLGDGYAGWLEDLYEKVTSRLTMIVYSVEEDQEAGAIFETMNDRGKELTELEKVKNHLLYLSKQLVELTAPHDLHKRINETWAHIYRNLMACGLPGRNYEDQLLRTHWLMAYSYNTKTWENARSVKNRFNLRNYNGRHPELLQELKDYLDSLKNACTAFCDIYKPDRLQAFNNFTDPEQRQIVIWWSKKLARLGPRASFLPLLEAMRLRHAGDAAGYLQVVQRLEKYDFRVFAWLGARSNTGESTFYRFAYQVYHGSSLDWLIEELDQQILSHSPKADFAARFERSGLDWYNWGGIDYFLYEYEHHLAGMRPVQLTWELIKGRPKQRSIEHILPQTPTQEWKDAFTEEQRKKWTNDIGNLTLTYDNSSLSNLNFKDKKGQPGETGRYAGSPLFIEHQLARYETWGEMQVLERRRQMQAWALERWKVDAEPRPKPDVKTFEDLCHYAARFDLDEVVLAVHNELSAIGSWPTVRKGLQYRYPYNTKKSILNLYVYPEGLSIYIHMENFGAFPNMTVERARNLLDATSGWNWYSTGGTDRLLDGLRAFQQEAFPQEEKQ